MVVISQLVKFTRTRSSTWNTV